MKLLCAAAVLVLCPWEAAAQGGRMFIQAGPLLDGLFTSAVEVMPIDAGLSSSVTYGWNDLNGDRLWQPGEETGPIIRGLQELEIQRSLERRFVPGVSAAVGVFLTPSISLRLEGSFQQEHVFTTEAWPLRLSMPSATRQEVSTSDVLIAAGWHQGESQRVTMTYLAGMVFRRQHDAATLTFQYSVLPATGGRPFTLTDEQHFESTLYTAGIVAGVDAAINLSQSIAIVPQFRMVAANRDWNLRPALTLRWRP